MASKYAHLNGKVPEQQTEREQAVSEFLEEFRKTDTTTGAVAKRYNGLCVEAAELAAKVKVLNQKIDAADIMMQERLQGDDTEAVRSDGYTWSRSFEPYPVCEDPEQIVKYFKEHDMEGLLVLRAGELASRLKNHVKEEAQNNELIIDIETDPDTGVEVKRTVRSQIPGVKVFLKASLSRTKSSTKKE